jgi:hypothetical protein
MGCLRQIKEKPLDSRSKGEKSDPEFAAISWRSVAADNRTPGCTAGERRSEVDRHRRCREGHMLRKKTFGPTPVGGDSAWVVRGSW